MNSIKKFPVYFISHGAPNLILQQNDPTFIFLKQLGKNILLKKNEENIPLKAILMISAHWEEKEFTISTNPKPETIYDFYGFEDEMYTLTYPVNGFKLLSERIFEILNKNNINCKYNSERGYDHGNWMPLKILFPEANIPVVQLSLKTSLNPSEHYQLGKLLKPLRDEGYLIIGSGGVTHNLRYMSMGDIADDWAKDFESWLENVLINYEDEKREELLINFQKQKSAKLAHPRIEHFLPLIVVAGMGGKATKIYNGWSYKNLSLAAYEFK